ncbi:MAG: universal stress protein E [Oceanicoccus sp.]|jgi:universal stress protein E
MAAEPERVIFIVVDPAQDKPLALKRALHTANRVGKNVDSIRGEVKRPRLHVFLAVDYDNTDTSADNPAMHRSGDWFFEQVINPLQESGLSFKLAMSWSSDWYGSILVEAAKQSPELIMLPLVSRPSQHERIFNESIWKLMRTAECPVLVVQPDSPDERKKVLVAINIQSHKPEYQELNDNILERGQWLAKSHGAELHIVNAYKDSMNYLDRGKLAEKTKVDTARIHVRAGDPDDVIAAVANELGVDMVVLGTRKRASRWRGNTAEKIVTKVSCDILAIH